MEIASLWQPASRFIPVAKKSQDKPAGGTTANATEPPFVDCRIALGLIPDHAAIWFPFTPPFKLPSAILKSALTLGINKRLRSDFFRGQGRKKSRPSSEVFVARIKYIWAVGNIYMQKPATKFRQPNVFGSIFMLNLIEIVMAVAVLAIGASAATASFAREAREGSRDEGAVHPAIQRKVAGVFGVHPATFTATAGAIGFS